MAQGNGRDLEQRTFAAGEDGEVQEVARSCKHIERMLGERIIDRIDFLYASTNEEFWYQVDAGFKANGFSFQDLQTRPGHDQALLTSMLRVIRRAIDETQNGEWPSVQFSFLKSIFAINTTTSRAPGAATYSAAGINPANRKAVKNAIEAVFDGEMADRIEEEVLHKDSDDDETTITTPADKPRGGEAAKPEEGTPAALGGMFDRLNRIIDDLGKNQAAPDESDEDHGTMELDVDELESVDTPGALDLGDDHEDFTTTDGALLDMVEAPETPPPAPTSRATARPPHSSAAPQPRPAAAPSISPEDSNESTVMILEGDTLDEVLRAAVHDVEETPPPAPSRSPVLDPFSPAATRSADLPFEGPPPVGADDDDDDRESFWDEVAFGIADNAQRAPRPTAPTPPEPTFAEKLAAAAARIRAEREAAAEGAPRQAEADDLLARIRRLQADGDTEQPREARPPRFTGEGRTTRPTTTRPPTADNLDSIALELADDDDAATEFFGAPENDLADREGIIEGGYAAAGAPEARSVPRMRVAAPAEPVPTATRPQVTRPGRTRFSAPATPTDEQGHDDGDDEVQTPKRRGKALWLLLGGAALGTAGYFGYHEVVRRLNEAAAPSPEAGAADATPTTERTRPPISAEVIGITTSGPTGLAYTNLNWAGGVRLPVPTQPDQLGRTREGHIVVSPRHNRADCLISTTPLGTTTPTTVELAHAPANSCTTLAPVTLGLRDLNSDFTPKAELSCTTAGDDCTLTPSNEAGRNVFSTCKRLPDGELKSGELLAYHCTSPRGTDMGIYSFPRPLDDEAVGTFEAVWYHE